MAVLALVAMAISLYLTWSRLSGEPPVCGPLRGCETVEQSEYAVLLGIPVALFGAGASLVTLVAALAWWRRDDRRGLMVAYAIGLVSLPIIAYLTYLELFVIEAVCAWCVAYAIAVISGWLVATLALARDRAARTT
jgi:uncharacterized membrane protein